MIDWRDEGILLAVRAHGETSVIIDVFTSAQGRQAGVVRGGVSRKLAPALQPGAQLDLTWRARLEDQLGSFTVELRRSRSGVLADRLALAGLNAICALLCFALAERDPHPDLYLRTEALLEALAGLDPDWIGQYLRWEMLLLEEMGYALDLGRCAVTGARDDLAYVSPRSGRAVSRGAAGDWAPRLLPLPAVLMGQGRASLAEIGEGLRTTGHFLTHRLAAGIGHRPLPAARQRLVEALERAALRGEG